MKENGPGGRTWLLVVVPLVIPGALYAAFFVGREVISHYRSFFDPRTWFRTR